MLNQKSKIQMTNQIQNPNIIQIFQKQLHLTWEELFLTRYLDLLPV